MSMAADDSPDRDHIVVLHDVSWEDYEHVLRIRGEHSAPRISYLETLKKKAKRRGVEADECYIFGTKRRDRPHLAIEVE